MLWRNQSSPFSLMSHQVVPSWELNLQDSFKWLGLFRVFSKPWSWIYTLLDLQRTSWRACSLLSIQLFFLFQCVCLIWQIGRYLLGTVWGWDRSLCILSSLPRLSILGRWDEKAGGDVIWVDRSSYSRQLEVERKEQQGADFFLALLPADFTLLIVSRVWKRIVCWRCFCERDSAHVHIPCLLTKLLNMEQDEQTRLSFIEL